MDKLYMFQARFGKVDKFGWWDMEIIKTEMALSLPPSSFSKVFLFGGGATFISGTRPSVN